MWFESEYSKARRRSGVVNPKAQAAVIIGTIGIGSLLLWGALKLAAMDERDYSDFRASVSETLRPASKPAEPQRIMTKAEQYYADKPELR